MYCGWIHIASILTLSVSHSLDSSPKVGAFGSPCKVYHYAKASPFGRGVTIGDGEGEPAEKRTFFAFSPKTQLYCKKCYNFFLKKAVFPLTALL